jgi:hypothetical protein
VKAIDRRLRDEFAGGLVPTGINLGEAFSYRIGIVSYFVPHL